MTELVSREPNHLVLATIVRNDVELRDVRCRVYLPIELNEQPRALLEPGPAEFARLTQGEGECSSFRADVFDYDKSVRTTLEASLVYVVNASHRSWGPNLTECFVELELWDLRIIDNLAHGDTKNESVVTFWISRNRMLAPHTLPSRSYTGEITIERTKVIECALTPSITLRFDDQYEHSQAETGETTQRSRLVATGALPLEARDISGLQRDVLPHVDDLLLIASLASGTRTVCLGWQTIDDQSATTIYRRDQSLPSGPVRSAHDGLILPNEFEEFLRVCHDHFLELERPQSVRRGIYTVVPTNPGSLEESFLSLFAAMEELVLDFRRHANLEEILPEEQWGVLRKHLESAIKICPDLEIEKVRRAWLYDKLSELNRVPLRAAFTEFCDAKNVDLKDLWDMFSSAHGPSLYSIRNRLTHGLSLPADAFDALWGAKEHLTWTVQRMLLAMLGWRYERSDVHPSRLASKRTAMQRLAGDRERLAAIFSDG